MNNLFEGQIEYNCTNNFKGKEPIYELKEIFYIKNEHLRVDIYNDDNETIFTTKILTPSNIWIIKHKERLIYFHEIGLPKVLPLETSHSKDNVIVLNYPCQSVKLKWEADLGAFNYQIFFNKEFLISPQIISTNPIFNSGYLPLKYSTCFKGNFISNSTFIATEIERKKLTESIFDVNSDEFRSFSIISYTEYVDKQNVIREQEEIRKKIKEKENQARNNFIYRPLLEILPKFDIVPTKEMIDSPYLIRDFVFKLDSDKRDSILRQFLKVVKFPAK